MALSTPASGTERGGGLGAPPEPSPGELRAQSPRSERGDADGPASRSTSLWRDAVRRLLKYKLAVAGGAVVILLCLIAIFADLLAPYSYTKTNFGRLNEVPTRDYLLGTDNLGRDLLSR